MEQQCQAIINFVPGAWSAFLAKITIGFAKRQAAIEIHTSLTSPFCSKLLYICLNYDLGGWVASMFKFATNSCSVDV